MATVPDLTVHDVVVRDDVSTLSADFGKTYTLVTFFVGDHGPFRLRIPKEQATGDYINGQIEHQVAELRKTTGIGY